MLSRRELELLSSLVTQAKLETTSAAQAARAVVAKTILVRELKILDATDYGFITKREETPDASS